eukprot:NODE_246_length_12992_cov_0.264407.p9 type:complete len:214 gc:universal NODE_246_length_12992_cov_0.264407:12846-12205(-)
MAARNIYIKYLHPCSIPPQGSESVSNHRNGDLALLVSLWIFSIFSEIWTFNEEFSCFETPGRMSDDENNSAEQQRSYRPHEEITPLHTIYIKNLSKTTRAKDLGVLFERFGKLIRCDVPEPRPGQDPYAFVEFESSDDAHKAFNEMQNQDVQDYKIELAWARRRTGRSGFRGRFPPRGSYRGGYRGGPSGYRGGRGRYNSSPYARNDGHCIFY